MIKPPSQLFFAQACIIIGAPSLCAFLLIQSNNKTQLCLDHATQNSTAAQEPLDCSSDNNTRCKKACDEQIHCEYMLLLSALLSVGIIAGNLYCFFSHRQTSRQPLLPGMRTVFPVSQSRIVVTAERRTIPLIQEDHHDQRNTLPRY